MSADDLVDNTIEFVKKVSGSRSGIFFWVGPNCEIVDPKTRNIQEALLADYTSDLKQYDPLHISRLKEDSRQIAMMHADGYLTGSDFCGYHDHLRSIDVGDEIDFVFWRNNRPYACLAMFRGARDRPFTSGEFDWAALHSYVHSSLRLHWRVRADEVECALAGRYRLHPREREVVRLITQGKSNADISEILGISIATVKVHVVNILKKLGVDSRLGIASFVMRLQQS
ncbi:MAG: LuxR C-terminal-related transcriptional regulator [Sphingomonadaceae bacterium]